MEERYLNNRCVACGAELNAPVRRDEPYHSLPGVILRDLATYSCPNCGEEEIAIPDLEGLNRVIARWLAEKPGRLTGAEVRFCRKVMGWSGRAFALLIAVTPETVSRWENDKEPIGSIAERLLRVLVTQKVAPITDYDAFERWMNQLAEQAGEGHVNAAPLYLHQESDGWHREIVSD